MAHILERSHRNLKVLIDYEPIAEWLKTNDPAAFSELHSQAYGLEVSDVDPELSTGAGYAALGDAQALLRTRGLTSAVDRVHAALHAFLKGACADASIPFQAEATLNQLLRLLLGQHPSLQQLGPRSDEIRRMLRTSAAIVDAMGTIRNLASLAPPNEELLDKDEALLVLNLARSLIRFLDAKLQ